MKIENLKENMLIKNYKELCNILEIKNTAGEAKMIQLKEVERFIKLEKQGNKFLIKEIYQEPLKKIDLRENNKGGNNNVYTDDFREIMLFLIYSTNQDTFLFSKTKLIKTLELVNQNYFKYKLNVSELKDTLNIQEDVLYDFYDTTQIKLDSLIRRNLQKMRSEALLLYEEVICIAKYKTTIAKNKKGEVIVDNGNILSDVRVEYREATKEEKQQILVAEKNVLEQLQLKNKQQVFLKGKWKDFKYRVQELLKAHNIKFYYSAYKITRSNYIYEKQKDIYNNLTNLNNNVIKSINSSANNRHSKAKENYFNTNNKFMLDKYIIRQRNDYIDNMRILANYLISSNAKETEIIKDEIKTKELEEFEDFHSYVIGG